MKSNLLKSILFFFCLVGVAKPATAQDEKFKAIFIYNFTKYINWPANAGSFVITILGNGNIVNEIEGIASKKTVGSTSIETKRINTIAETGNCQILFITAGKTDMLPEAFILAKSKNILLITEKPLSCKSGSCINFLSRDGKLTFEISKANIESCGLGVSTDLLKLGVSN